MSYETHADLGGARGYGRVIPEGEGELFHAEWEPRALALTLAMGATGAWNLDMSRGARETLPDYASLGYYAIWIEALEKLMLGRDLIGSDEIAAGRSLQPPRPLPRVLKASDVEELLSKGAPTERSASAPPRFAVGEPVRTRSSPVPHHTRLPGYARGKLGRIEHIRGVHVFADTHAQGLGEDPQWLYTVVFDARALWGAEADARQTVSIDAWEPYLVRATPGDR
jgi:nitrile hydratase